METKTMTPNNESNQPSNVPSPEQIKAVDELNANLTEKNGEWKYIPDVGIAFVPTIGDLMGQPISSVVKPPANPVSPLMKEMVEWANTIDFDNIPMNAVIIIRLNIDDPFRAASLQKGIVKTVLDPRFQKLKEKRVCILFMSAGDDISVMTEQEMNAAGWEKKDKSLIIKPFEK